MGIAGNLVRSVRGLDDGKIKKIVPIRHDRLGCWFLVCCLVMESSTKQYYDLQGQSGINEG